MRALLPEESDIPKVGSDHIEAVDWSGLRRAAAKLSLPTYSSIDVTMWMKAHVHNANRFVSFGSRIIYGLCGLTLTILRIALHLPNWIPFVSGIGLLVMITFAQRLFEAKVQQVYFFGGDEEMWPALVEVLPKDMQAVIGDLNEEHAKGDQGFKLTFTVNCLKRNFSNRLIAVTLAIGAHNPDMVVSMFPAPEDRYPVLAEPASS